MNRYELIRALAEAKLGSVAELIALRARPCFDLFTERRDDSAIPIGASKVGGAADLPPGIEWPMGLGNYLSFVAQVNLADLPFAQFEALADSATQSQQQASFFKCLNLPCHEPAPLPREHLPDRGLLSFFYEREAGLRSFDPRERGTRAVLYSDLPTVELERAPVPEPLLNPRPLHRLNHVAEPAIFPPLTLYFSACRLAFAAGLSLPASADDLEGITLSEEQQSNYWDFTHPYIPFDARLMNARAGGRPSHQIFGYARSVQWGTTPPGESLLLQLDSDPEANMMWGDVGILYYFLPTDDLHTVDLSSVYAYEDMH